MLMLMSHLWSCFSNFQSQCFDPVSVVVVVAVVVVVVVVVLSLPSSLYLASI